MAQQSPSRKSREKKRVPLATLVDHQLAPDVAKLTAQVVFKETDEYWDRLSVLARRARRQPAYVARAIFRVGLLAIENAIQGGVL